MKILVVDDDPEVGRTLSALLRKRRHVVTITMNGPAALALAAAEVFDLVFLDVRMPEMDGFAVLRALKEQGCAAAVIMLTGQGDADDAVKASHQGAHDYLPKPVRLIALERAIANVATKHDDPEAPKPT